MEKTFAEVMSEARKDIQAVEYWTKKGVDTGDIKIRYVGGADDLLPGEARKVAENIANCAGVALDIFAE